LTDNDSLYVWQCYQMNVQCPECFLLLTGEKDSIAPDAHYPAFREELVCTLLETLLAYPQAPLAANAESPTQATPSEVDLVQGQLEQLALARAGPAQGTPPGPSVSSWDELPNELAAAAAQQRAAELTEWLGCAKIALQAGSWLQAFIPRHTLRDAIGAAGKTLDARLPADRLER
jgi:hypothetical protein